MAAAANLNGAGNDPLLLGIGGQDSGWCERMWRFMSDFRTKHLPQSAHTNVLSPAGVGIGMIGREQR